MAHEISGPLHGWSNSFHNLFVGLLNDLGQVSLSGRGSVMHQPWALRLGDGGWVVFATDLFGS